MTRIRQLSRTGLLTIAWLLVVPCLFLLLSAIIPIIPWVRIYAIDVVPNHAPWFLLCALAGLAVGLLTHIRRATSSTRGLIVTASVATLAAASVIAHFLYIAERNGARIDLVKALGTRDYSESAGPDESRVYSALPGEPLSLDIYRPAAGAARGPSPVLVVVHGGGFVEGTRRIGAANMRSYADVGWTVISIDYRLARPDRPTWNLATRDVRCALAWIASNAAALHIDLTRLTLSGASAGGSLAMAAAYSTDAGGYDTRCGAHIPRVAAVIAKAPLIDAAGSWHRTGEFRDLQQSYMTRYLGGSPERYPDRYAAVDLRNHIRPDNPPTLILAGADDPLLSVAALQSFVGRSAAAGGQVRLITFPYAGHDFNKTFDSIANQAVIQIVRQFLADHGLGPTTTRTQYTGGSRPG